MHYIFGWTLLNNYSIEYAHYFTVLGIGRDCSTD